MSYELEPIVVRREYPAVKMTKQGEKTLFDIGQNQAGVCRLTLCGKKGDKITIRYCDIINDKGELDQSPLSCFIKNYTFQTEIYTKRATSLRHGTRNLHITAISMLKYQAAMKTDSFLT